MKCIRPIYLQNFQCDGQKCGSRCCKGWHIIIDDESYQKYSSLKDTSASQQILSQIENFDEKPFFKMKDNFDCPFLDEDYLCKIQKQHGEDFLTAICQSYPRITYQLDDVLEESLTLTCPLAARLVLLQKSPIEFEETDLDKPRMCFEWTDRLPFSTDEAIVLQMKVIAILQDRTLNLNERLFKVCTIFKLEDDMIIDEVNFDIKKHAKLMVEIFCKMYNMELNEQKKINLQSIYLLHREEIYFRLTENYLHIFENYLVNEFFMRCYPFAFKGGLWQNCKIFVIGYKAIEFAMISMAISKKGLIGVEEFLIMIDAVNEKLDHNRDGMQAILELATSINTFKDFTEIMLDINLS